MRLNNSSNLIVECEQRVNNAPYDLDVGFIVQKLLVDAALP